MAVPLTSLEIASGMLFGAENAPALPSVRRADAAPRRALEETILRALQRSPCVVSFSGGRDSSAILAVAATVARRHGMDPPLPVTFRFMGAQRTQEIEWQELVIRHLGLNDWEPIEVNKELEYLGPVARGVLQRKGLLWPSNTFVHQPIFRRAQGGSVLTGIDGDGLFGRWGWRKLADAVAGRARRNPRDLLRLGLALSPRGIKRHFFLRRRRHPLPWLTDEAEKKVVNDQIAEDVSEPLRWRNRVHWWSQRRYLHVVKESFQTVADENDVEVATPFLDGAFLANLAAVAPTTGLGDRTALMKFLFSDLLPDPVITRSTKAIFDEAFWGDETRDFVRSWDGSGVDPALIDVDTLIKTWSEPTPDARSIVLLHEAWLSSFSSDLS